MSIYTLEKKIELALKACYSYAKADASIGDDYHKNKIYAQRASIMEEVKSYMAEVIGEGKPQVLRKSKLEYDTGWCDGREQLRQDQRIRAGLSQPATRHGKEGEE